MAALYLEKVPIADLCGVLADPSLIYLKTPQNAGWSKAEIEADRCP